MSADTLVGERSFTVRVEPLMEPLLRYFVRRVVPRDDAYDCLSETLVVLWRRWAKCPADPDELRAWSFGVAKRVLANHLRGQNRRARLSAKALDNVDARGEESTIEIEEALTTLNHRDRELVRLIVWDGLGVAEAGSVLGLRPDAARARYSRARAKLREAIA
ncbi:sigma-70 family RNA polymerase sigma factor [Glaciihabitans arcticus]|uniref:Sigma-70 family RNA polymerase sigma factor n=1 Tax=Glaciihabitans arcticus TaxID=2668039 RepID=A0A4Q9GXC5_9MICO|nr:sigma-70 family RNA polymerase sigma factor [Glaciihabitans arcticus]TBN56920.1 sigma-70 family RNA polymerase sigma factor [Glaciihabitans arcticus]